MTGTRASSFTRLALLFAVVAFRWAWGAPCGARQSFGCTATALEAGPGRVRVRRRPAPPRAEVGRGGPRQPIGLEYACGNRFAVTNSAPVPVTRARTGWRAADEEGTVGLQAGAGGGPAVQRGADRDPQPGDGRALLDGRAVAARANDRVPCAPAAAGAPRRRRQRTREAGAWAPTFDWPIVAVHLHLLPERAGALLGRRRARRRSGTRRPAPSRRAQPGPALLRRPCVPRGRPAARGGRPHRDQPRPARHQPLRHRSAGWARRGADGSGAAGTHRHHHGRTARS